MCKHCRPGVIIALLLITLIVQRSHPMLYMRHTDADLRLARLPAAGTKQLGAVTCDFMAQVHSTPGCMSDVRHSSHKPH
jgi:hypothetical protein